MQLQELEDGTLIYMLGLDVEDPAPRWKATITYKTIAGQFSVPFVFEELEELHDIVETGPDFYAIVDIKVELNRDTPTPLEVLN